MLALRIVCKWRQRADGRKFFHKVACFAHGLGAEAWFLAPLYSHSVLTASKGAANPQVADFLEMSSFIFSKYC